jgi:hypothetical protein
MDRVALPEKTLPEEPVDDYLPKAVGHKLVIVVEERPETFDDSEIVKPEETRTLEQHMMQVGCVVDMGPDAYSPLALDAGGGQRFPSGPWCALGDYVLLDRYGGTKFRLGKNIVRVVNDDAVEGTVAKPRLMVKLLGA